MVVCNSCGSREVSPEDVYLTNVSGRWTTRCRNCPGASEDEMPHGGNLDWMKTPSRQTPPEVFRTLNNLRACHGLNPFTLEDDNRREYERHVVELTGFYQRKNSEERYPVSILDLSKGGLRFRTDQRLNKAEVLRINIANPEQKQDEIDFKFSTDIEIVRVSALQDGYEIGARFINNAANKRSAPRHQLLLTVWYQRKGQEEASEGAVLDISRTGVGMIVSEKIAVGEVLAVCIRGDSGVFAKQELRGLVRVVHAACLYAGNYELGTEFIKTKIAARKGKTGNNQTEQKE